MSEIWADIDGGREHYQISSYGNARTIDREGTRGNLVKGHYLTPHKNSNGYYRYSMATSGKQKEYLAHRLVAEAFIPNPDNLPCVNHIDGNKENNSVNNLEWCTKSQNELHAHKIGLKKASSLKGELHGGRIFNQSDIDKIREEYIYGDREHGQCALARKYRTSQSHIWAIVHNKNWKNKYRTGGN